MWNVPDRVLHLKDFLDDLLVFVVKGLAGETLLSHLRLCFIGRAGNAARHWLNGMSYTCLRECRGGE